MEMPVIGVGPEMSGGRITIKKNAGHMVGAAYRGHTVGITGGEIFVHGDAKNELVVLCAAVLLQLVGKLVTLPV